MHNHCGRTGPKLCHRGGHSSHARGAEGRAGVSEGEEEEEEEGGWWESFRSAPTCLFHVSTKLAIKSSDHYISSINGESCEMLYVKIKQMFLELQSFMLNRTH